MTDVNRVKKNVQDSKAKAAKVPVQEDVKVIDMKLGELFLGVIACATLAGVGFTYYAHIKARSEERRIQAISKAVSTIVSEIGGTIAEKKSNVTPVILESKKPGRKQNVKRMAQA